jgi:hypothetical protein
MSSIFKAWGSIEQGKAGYASNMSEAYAQEYNAQIADSNAKTVLEQANAKEEAQRRQFHILQGKAIAGMAQSGTGLDGSNLDVLEQSATNAELDALTIRYEGQMQNRGLMAQAALGRYQAQGLKANAKRAMKAGYIGAAANLLEGASKAYQGGG